MVLLVKCVQCCLGLFPVLYGAVGHRVGHKAELAEEDLPQEEVDPWVQDLVERGHADRREKEVTVQIIVVAGGGRGVALVGGDVGGDHPQHQTLREGQVRDQFQEPNSLLFMREINSFTMKYERNISVFRSDEMIQSNHSTFKTSQYLFCLLPFFVNVVALKHFKNMTDSSPSGCWIKSRPGKPSGSHWSAYHCWPFY